MFNAPVKILLLISRQSVWGGGKKGVPTKKHWPASDLTSFLTLGSVWDLNRDVARDTVLSV